MKRLSLAIATAVIACGCSKSAVTHVESIKLLAYDGHDVTIEFGPSGPDVLLTKDATVQLHLQLKKLLDTVGPNRSEPNVPLSRESPKPTFQDL